MSLSKYIYRNITKCEKLPGMSLLGRLLVLVMIICILMGSNVEVSQKKVCRLKGVHKCRKKHFKQVFWVSEKKYHGKMM